MDIREINDQAQWDNFIKNMSDFTFLQGWSWGEFQVRRGERVWRFGIYSGQKLIGVCQVVSVTARRGSFLFVPHGPLAHDGNVAPFLPSLIQKLVALATTLRYAFIRISPLLESSGENGELFSSLGFRAAPSYMHAEETWLLPLEGEDVALLAGMRKTTRNLISRALRDGVEITKSTSVHDVPLLLDLQGKTAMRHKFVPFSDSYIKDEFEIFSRRNEILLFLGKYRGVVSSAALIIFYKRRAFYFQSGSVKSDAPVSHLLQWEVIKEAKRRGCVLYNLWGVAPEHEPDHQWAGITTFKSGFGGYRKNYMHAIDLPLLKRYWVSWLIERFPRRLRLRLRLG